MSCHENRYAHVHYAWDDVYASRLSPLEALVYRSKTLGADRRITHSGGGSTSVKIMERDPVTGEPVEVIWIKSSGRDLRISKGQHFFPLYQQKLVALRDNYQHRTLSYSNAETEETLAERIQAAAFSRNASAPSVDTPLHALMPYAHVNHIHPSSAIAVGACRNSSSLTTKIWGEAMLWVPRKRPGVEQGIQLQEAWSRFPNAKGALLAGNGIVTWSDDNKACYQQSLDITEAASRYIAAHDKGESTFGGSRYVGPDEATRQTLLASTLLFLRELVSEGEPLIAALESGPTTMRFVNSVDAPRLATEGVACMHHLRHTKLNPLYVAWDPDGETTETLKRRLQQGVERYRQEYRAYYDTNRQNTKNGTVTPIRATAPSVCLIPGIGMIAWGRTESEARITSEAYQGAIEVMRSAEAIDAYMGLPEQDAFGIEYQLE